MGSVFKSNKTSYINDAYFVVKNKQFITFSLNSLASILFIKKNCYSVLELFLFLVNEIILVLI